MNNSFFPLGVLQKKEREVGGGGGGAAPNITDVSQIYWLRIGRFTHLKKHYLPNI